MRLFLLIVGVLLLTGCETKGEGLSNSTREPIVPGEQSVSHNGVGDRVFFGLNSILLDDEAQATLKRQAEKLKEYSDYKITIEGHADERGTREYNIGLGERRADAVKSYLLAHGVEESAIKTISYGKEYPEDTGENEAAWSKNRRAVTSLAQHNSTETKIKKEKIKKRLAVDKNYIPWLDKP